jgi:hypothetical protein
VSPSPELEKELEEMRQKYLETCTTLGNYYVMSDCSDEWKLALPYYRISQQSVYKILTQAKALWMNQGEESKEGTWVQIPPGLLHYMVEVILNPVPGEDVLEASLADLIIDLLGEYALQVSYKMEGTVSRLLLGLYTNLVTRWGGGLYLSLHQCTSHRV